MDGSSEDLIVERPAEKRLCSAKHSPVDDGSTVDVQRLPRNIRGVIAREKNHAAATSSGCPGRFIGVSLPNISTFSAGYDAGISGVQIGPGATAFTRMPRPTIEFESARVNETIAPLVEE